MRGVYVRATPSPRNTPDAVTGTVHTSESRNSRAASLTLTVAALGVVFGDIGTSPLYAMKEVFNGPHVLGTSTTRIYGVLSLMFWTLLTIVTVKFVAIIMRVDNDGEGGIMALVALVKRTGRATRMTWSLILVGIFGAALFYGDGMITPAISVLSAVEGLGVAAPSVEPLVIPLSLVVLTGLFLVQRRGTGAVGKLFGPVMLVWFFVLAALGVVAIAHNPSVLHALSPTYAVQFFAENGTVGFLALGSVVLAVTGMGHFGRAAISRAWLLIAFPALLLNYFGQGALLLDDPNAIDNPFFRLAPDWGQLPLVVLATVATVVASQAVITGAFSMTRQAVQLGFLPRMTIRHTSASEAGQVYVPVINWILFVAVAALILGFRSSSNLASAYGIAVTATLAIDTILAFIVIRRLWGKPLWMVVATGSVLLVVDLAFFAASTTKILHGGWFPIAIGVIAFTLLSTWWKGRQMALQRMNERAMPLDRFIRLMRAQQARGAPGVAVQRIPGTAVYLTALDGAAPLPLTRNIEHYHVLNEHIVLFTSTVRGVPSVPDDDRLEITQLGQGIVRVVAAYGFQEQPNVPAALRLAATRGLDVDPEHASYFLGHVTMNPVDSVGMALWRKRLFVAMSKSSLRASTYLGVRSDQVIEVGTQIDL